MVALVIAAGHSLVVWLFRGLVDLRRKAQHGLPHVVAANHSGMCLQQGEAVRLLLMLCCAGQKLTAARPM